MLIGVISDTHDNLPMIARAVEELKARGAQMLLHAGDYVAAFAVKEILAVGLPLVGVFGNNDGEKEGLRRVHEGLFDEPHRLELGGRRIVMAHLPQVLTRALCEGDHVGIYGHTHVAEVKRGTPLVLNPGEVGGWLTGRCTAAVVDLEDMDAEIVELGTQRRPGR